MPSKTHIYGYEFTPKSHDHSAEAIITNYLFTHSSLIRLHRMWSVDLLSMIFRPKKYTADDSDPEFIKSYKSIKPFFVKRMYSGVRNSSVDQTSNKVNREIYDYFDITNKSFQKILTQHLFDGMFFVNKTPFYGYEEPLFLSGDKVIGGVNKSLAWITLTDDEYQKFLKHGVTLFKFNDND